MRYGPLTLLTCGLLAACAGADNTTGTVVISAAGDVDGLFPPTARLQQSQQVTDLVFDRLAEVGRDVNTIGDAGWVPRLAERWTWNADSSAVTFHLNPRARWHDSVPVRARDVKFAFDVYADPVIGNSAGASFATLVDSVTVGDSVTATAWFKQRTPERFYALVFNLVPLPEHLLGSVPRDSLARAPFARAPVGSGPYRFVRWDAKQRIEIAAVPGHYRGNALPSRVIWSIVPDGQTAAQRIFIGEADFIAQLTPPEVADVPKHADVRAVRLRSNVLGYILFNTRDGASDRPHPILGDRNVRRALTMALDKQAVVRNLFDSLGTVAHGHFTSLQWSADTTLRQLPFDRAAAAHILDSLGWKAGANGMRARAGKPLALSVIVPSSSANRQRLAVLLQEQWRQVGVDLAVEKLELAAMNARTGARTFDVMLQTILTNPSPAGIKQFWSTAAITMSNGLNLGRYSSPATDAAIDSALVAPSPAAARAQYRNAYQLLLDDAPAIWLFEPVIVAGVNQRLVLDSLQDHAWWLSIPHWRIAPGRSPRAEGSAQQP